jgi:hypothetical protein
MISDGAATTFLYTMTIAGLLAFVGIGYWWWRR